ncbi:hypothetical protein MUP77_08690 [Candidatus Bathyarchaeota archaeon]|nr:hypothetical protein [Candidatus Bathyarchaeota archaeon]
MKLTNASLERTYNLGNYESLRVGLEAQLSEQDNPLDVWKQLEDLAEMYLQTRLSKAEEKPVAKAKPAAKQDDRIPLLKYDITQQAPSFDPKELMEHKGWKARKQYDGSYAEGSLSFGWDFADQFKPDIINVLKKGSVNIDQYEFSLSASGTLVQTKKKKD